MVEAQLSGGNLHDDVGVVSHSLVTIGKDGHEVISEYLISNAGRTKTVEFDWVFEAIDVTLNIENSKGCEGATERVTCEKNRYGLTMKSN